MTLKAFSHWRSSSVKIAAALFLCSSCTSNTYDSSGETHRPRVARSVASQFEWAVQHYEAGDYQKAIENFEKLRKVGAEVPEFDLLPFYVGMSHFRLTHFEKAVPELEAFARSSGARQEGQDARIALLLAYEKLGRWKELSGLAAETDKLTLFQYNRALLKLVWARSLREQGELMGAKTVLQEATPYLDKASPEDRAVPYYADPDQDLWGRYYFTSILVQEMDCNRLGPKEFPGKSKKARTRRLYAPWLESVVDCFRKGVTLAAEELFQRESPWCDFSESSLSQGIEVFGRKISGYVKEESGLLDRKNALEKNGREQLYRLLGTLDEHIKIFKNRGLNSKPLERLRKQVDRLLVSISHPS